MAGTSTQCAQPLLRRLLVKAEGGSDPESAVRGKEWSLLKGPQAERAVPTQTSGPAVRWGKGDRWIWVGTGVKGLGPQTIHWWGVCLQSLQSPEFQDMAELRWVKGVGGRRRNHQGEAQDRDQCPGGSHGTTKRPAVQRTKEMIRTQATSTGNLLGGW